MWKFMHTYKVRFIYIILVLLCCAIGCQKSDNLVDDISSTKGSLQGEVQNNKNVTSKILLYQGEEIIAQTDSKGSFELTEIEAGTYLLRIVAPGFKEVELDVEILAGDVVSIDRVTLQPSSETELNPDGLIPGSGLKIGSDAPSFELPDGNGNLHSLSDTLSSGQHVVIVFYRFGG